MLLIPSLEVTGATERVPLLNGRPVLRHVLDFLVQHSVEAGERLRVGHAAGD